MFLVGRAYQLGFSIGTIPTAAPCPVSQREETNQEYRVEQFQGNYNGFLRGLKK